MNERQQKIQKIINQNGEIKLSGLEQLFPDVSSMTLRRDLEKLEKLGEIVRIHNGAKSIAHLSRLKEALYSERARENIAEKNLIAKKAYQLLKQGSSDSEGYSVFLDSGTTVTSLSTLLTEDNLFVITAAPNIALECAKNPKNSIFMTGGLLNGENLSLSGMNALNFLDNINIDMAIMAASGFSFKNSFTCGNFEECQLKKQVIDRAEKVVMLMDSTKYGKNLPFTFATLEDIDVLVSDDKFDNEALNELQKYEIEVI